MNDPTPTHSFGGAAASGDDLLDSTPTGATVLDALNASLAKTVVREPVTLKVPSRPGMSLVFNPDIEFELFQTWTQRASKGRKDGTPDYLRMALTVISHTNTDILMNGVSSGKTVKDVSVHTSLGVPTGAVGTAIRKLYAVDGHAIQVMRRIIEAAGYSLEGDEVDEDGDDPLVI